MFSTTERKEPGVNLARDSAKEVSGRRGLSRGQERETAVLIAGGDRAARNRMVQAYLGLVVVIARGFRGRGLVLDDLVAEGNLGLIRAAEKFDPEFGARFSTYANHWVKAAIRDALINRTATIRLPAHMVKLLAKWRRTEQMLARRGDHLPDFEEVACFLGLSERQKFRVSEAHRAGHVKLENNCRDGLANPLLDAVPDRHGPVDASLQADDERDSLLHRMESLDDRERTVLALRYGLFGETLTRKEVGKRLGLCGEWIRKIESGAIHKLGGDQNDGAAFVAS
jgi:RNA polymerase primary sigma factor